MKSFALRGILATWLLACSLAGLGPGSARAQGAIGHCDSCVIVVDSCCSKMPRIADPTFAPPARAVIETREPDVASFPFCVTLYDITQNIPAENVNWNPITRYHGPGGSWNATNLGTVFGLTLDKYGNIYVTHTSCYGNDILGPGGAGAIYRIDGLTGSISVFASLPNVADPNVPGGSNMPGLGNISYDCDHDQFFVTNMEDGRVYRIKSSNALNASPATVLNFFDPGTPDNGAPGWAPLTERLWGVQWHGNRVFYSVWATDLASPPNSNTIRSVALDGSGDFVWWSDRLEIVVPSFPTTPGISSPVSDLSFGPTGKMLLAERTMSGPTFPSAHQSRVLEYECQSVAAGGPWAASTATFNVGQLGSQNNAAGGVDYDYGPYDGPMPPATAAAGGLGGSQGRVWATGDALHFGSPNPDIVYGLEAFRPTGGTIANSLLIDSDGNVTGQDKTFIGDVEVPCPAPPSGRICGFKFNDKNHNGVQDAGEAGMAGWTIQINGPLSQTTTTGQGGTFCFTNLPAGTYVVSEVGQPGWVQTAPPGGTYTVTLPPDALNLAFGNYDCPGDPCLKPPVGMVSWWPLDEPGPSLAHDIMGGNLGGWTGSPVSVPGQVSRGLQCMTASDYVNCTPATNLNFGTGNFSIDAWILLKTQSSGVRTIVDKRFQAAGAATPAGYAMYVFNNRIGFQLGDGVTFQNLGWTGPALTTNVWHHVAVVVNRGSGNVILYQDAVSQTVPTTVTGSVTNSAIVRLGQRWISGPIAFEGVIDEVEIFKRMLTAGEVAALYGADGHGKCKKFCRVPKASTYWGTQQTLNVCFSIINRDWSAPMSANWSLAGLPAAAGCSVAGPTVFTPSSGTVTVPAGGSATVCVTIQRPAGLTPGQTACYQFTVLDSLSGTCFSCVSVLRASNQWKFLDPASTDLQPVPSDGTTAPVSFTVTNTGGVASGIPYRVVAEPEDADPANQAVRLNGLPPGEPVLGTLTLAPGASGTITVQAGYETRLGIPTQEIILSADLDGDGTFDDASSIGVEPGVGGTTAVQTGPPAAGLEMALGYPNPFQGHTMITFSLTREQPVSVRVYDVNGRLVRTLDPRTMAAGRHEVVWDGMDAQGQPTGPGIFFLSVESPERNFRAKVVRMK